MSVAPNHETIDPQEMLHFIVLIKHIGAREVKSFFKPINEVQTAITSVVMINT